MDLGVRGKGYLVVGGSAGIGRAAAAALAGDVTVAGDIERVVAEAVAALGDLRGVAATTGLGPRGQRDLLHGTDADWSHSFEEILLGTVRVCRAVVPVLVAAGGGSIVTTAAYSIRAPKPHQFPYAALKSGVASLTKNLAKSYGARGVRADCVCPGATETAVMASMRLRYAEERGWPVAEALERAMTEDWGMKVALGRVGTPRECGDVIAFLLSERASYLTGALVNVDGGTDF